MFRSLLLTKFFGVQVLNVDYALTGLTMLPWRNSLLREFYLVVFDYLNTVFSFDYVVSRLSSTILLSCVDDGKVLKSER